LSEPRALGILALVALLFVAPAEADPTRGGTLNFLVEQEPPTLVTIAHTAGATQRIAGKITEGLVTYDFDGKPVPVLATSWEIAPDGLSYTFHLRHGVKWHDGQDFTSADVAYSVQLLKTIHPRGRSTFANVSGVETPDAYTAIIVLSKPAPYLIAALDASESPIVPRHIYEGTDPLTNKNSLAPIGTGPFLFKSWDKGSDVILERNPNYWDAGKPYLDRVIVHFIPDLGARSAAFETGELDLGAGPPVALSEVARIEALPNIGHETRGYEYNGSDQQLFFNYENPIFQDQRVREAVAHAIDVQKLIDVVYFGLATIAPSPLSASLAAFYDPAIKPYAFDPKLAEKLLDEAGYPRKADGARFSIRLRYNPYNTLAEAQFVKQQLAAIGIASDLKEYDFSTYIQRIYTARDFDLTLESLSNVFDPTPGVQRAYWSKNFKIGLPFSNASHYADAEIDRLLESAAVEPDPAKRKQIWFKFQHRIYDTVAAINLLAPTGVTLFDKKVHNHTEGIVGVNGSFADVYIDK
jgi:peptide/nickel transport system substrate-binding protein